MLIAVVIGCRLLYLAHKPHKQIVVLSSSSMTMYCFAWVTQVTIVKIRILLPVAFLNYHGLSCITFTLWFSRSHATNSELTLGKKIHTQLSPRLLRPFYGTKLFLSSSVLVSLSPGLVRCFGARA